MEAFFWGLPHKGSEGEISLRQKTKSQAKAQSETKQIKEIFGNVSAVKTFELEVREVFTGISIHDPSYYQMRDKKQHNGNKDEIIQG